MKDIRFFLPLILAFFSVGLNAQEVPQASITNGLVTAKLYLPDVNNGYYRGTRFDWGGVMPELTYKNHSFFGKWFEQYSPTLHDAIMGPVEDFSPVGYETAEPGGRFVKIGIGVLTRPDTGKYFFAKTYPVVDYGKWQVTKKPDQVTFTHILRDPACSYDYVKTVRLVKGKSDLVLTHRFKNTGKETVETNVYDHNFFVFDTLSVAPGYEISFPFPIDTDTAKSSPNGQIRGNSILITKAFTKSDHVYYRSIEGFGPTAKDYDIRIENHTTGAGVRITCDRPLSKVVFWSAIKTVCPEPYITLKARPGEEFTWTITYHFYTLDNK